MRWVEATAWTLGALLALVYATARIAAEQERAAGIEAFYVEAAATPVAAPPTPSSEELEAPPAHVDQSLWSAERIAAFAAAAAEPGVPRAVLRIPSLDLAVPVFAGTSELNLNRGAGHIEGTAPLGRGFLERGRTESQIEPPPDGNIGIAAHRDGFFRPLEHIVLDAELVLETRGRTLRYSVTDIAVVEPTDVHVLEPTATPTLTLVTCYPFYFLGSAPKRYIVRAELAAALPPAAAADAHGFGGANVDENTRSER